MKPLLILFAAAFASCAEPQEEGKRLSVTVETTAVSSYLWRGFVVNDSPSLQSAITLDARGFTASVWSNLSRRPPHNQAWTETDISLGYSRRYRRIELSAVFNEYTFPDIAARAENHTEEFGVGIAVDTLLQPSFRYFRDVTLGQGSYYYAGVEHSLPVNRARGITATLTGGAGLNRGMFQRQTTISNVDLGIAVTIPFAKLDLVPQFTAMRGHRTLFGTHAAFGLKISKAM